MSLFDIAQSDKCVMSAIQKVLKGKGQTEFPVVIH